jgi:hypothetical protein
MPAPLIEPHACVKKQENENGNQAQPVEVVSSLLVVGCQLFVHMWVHGDFLLKGTVLWH